MIEIPGFRLLRPLGRGGMATVYLALQESVQREVALKVMSSTLLGDEQFGERFLREARIAARMRHPGVVQVHDVGIAGGQYYIAMEYLPGGPVLTRNGSPRPLGFALRVTREIAGALAYAQDKGVVHRDIKPDNILLREDGTAVLTDFGIARASDNVRMTRTGAIVGTPHYMSPEQARGLPLDGRADLYSLGIVFHELLVGRVPYQAEDSLAVGIMHITAPLPRLPEALQDLQPLLDRLLAKEPEQRFQDGNALAAAIQEFERNLPQASRVPAGPASRIAAPALASTHPVRTVPTLIDVDAVAPDGDGPQLGRIEDVLRTPSPRRRREPRRARGGMLWIVLALSLIGAGAVLWYQQDAWRNLLPHTRMNDLLAGADLALERGDLDGTDNRSARELYAAALALDPDSLRARQGLQQVGTRLLMRGRERLDAGDVAGARAALSQARNLSVPGAEADALQREIDARAAQGVALETLLEAAGAALAAGRLHPGEDGAVALFRRVLAADPGNALAGAGLRDALTAMLDRARGYIAAGQLEAAAGLIEDVVALDAAHLGLPDARATLAQARAARSAEIEARLVSAERLLASGRTLADAESARDAFRAVLAEDPNNTRARDGLRRIAAALVARADRAGDDHEFARAAEWLTQAEAVDPGVPGLAATRKRLAELEKRRGGRQAASDAAALQPRIVELLAQARQAAEAGNLLSPPGDSAYDKYRAIQRLAPDHPEARAGLEALVPLARAKVEQELASNRLLAARGAIDGLATLAPTDAQLPMLKRRLARSLLGQADERLGAGELARARQAFDAARELDPTNADLPAFQARLEQAGG